VVSGDFFCSCLFWSLSDVLRSTSDHPVAVVFNVSPPLPKAFFVFGVFCVRLRDFFVIGFLLAFELVAPCPASWNHGIMSGRGFRRGIRGFKAI